MENRTYSNLAEQSRTLFELRQKLSYIREEVDAFPSASSCETFSQLIENMAELETLKSEYMETLGEYKDVLFRRFDQN